MDTTTQPSEASSSSSSTTTLISVPNSPNYQLLQLCQRGEAKKVEEFLKVNYLVNLDLKSGPQGLTPLFAACSKRRHEVVALLLSYGADPTIKVTSSNLTAIELADRMRDAKMVEMLVSPPTVSLDSIDLISDFEKIQITEETCSICLHSNELLTIGVCSHKFCVDCIAGWIYNQIKDLNLPSCPSKDCKSWFSYNDVTRLIKDKFPTEFLSYEEVVTKRYLSKQSTFRSCPKCPSIGWIDKNTKCPNAICDACEFSFCTDCLLPSHEFSCRKNFDVLDTQDSERAEHRTEVWKFKFTKSCPFCHISIQKNGGCNHMTCKQCKFQYCWLCGNQWTGHNTQTCVTRKY